MIQTPLPLDVLATTVVLGETYILLHSWCYRT